MVTRRDFLRLLGICAASAALPVPKFVLAEPRIIIPSYPVELGAIRVSGTYDMYRCRFLIRLDAFNGKTNDQFSVDMNIPESSDPMENRKNYLEQLKLGEELLLGSLLNEGWMASDMIALPPIPGCHNFDWMHA